MNNTVIIQTMPVVLTDKQKTNPSWLLREKLAKQDLQGMQESIKRALKHSIAIYFNFELVLTLSINLRTFKITIDYSAIKDRKSVRLIKLYLSGDMHAFAEQWVKLA